MCVQPEPLQRGQGPGMSWEFSWFPQDTAAAQGLYNPLPQAVTDQAAPKSTGGAQPVGQHKLALGKATSLGASRGLSGGFSPTHGCPSRLSSCHR